MTNQSIPLINHYVALIHATEVADEEDSLVSYAESIVRKMNLTVVNRLVHSFNPNGITLCFVLSESHLIIHTWPEVSLIHIDLFTCSPRSKELFEITVESVIPNIISKEIYISGESTQIGGV